MKKVFQICGLFQAVTTEPVERGERCDQITYDRILHSSQNDRTQGLRLT